MQVYDLATGNQLLSVIFDVRPTCLVVNVTEVDVFIGVFDGTIKTFSLLDPPRNLDHHFKELTSELTFSGHTKSVTCLALSVDDSILVSGSVDETIRIWHIHSKQCTRIIRMKGAITNILVRMLPESLQSYEFQPNSVIKSFQKRYDENQPDQVLEINCPIDYYAERLFDVNSEREDTQILTNKLEELQRINHELFNFAKKSIINRK